MKLIQEKHFFYIFLIIFLGYFIKMAADIPQFSGVPGDLGPKFIPFWFALVGIILVSYLFIADLFASKKEEQKILSLHEVIALTLTISLIVLYLIGLQFLSFAISTFCFLFIYTLLANKLIFDRNPKPKQLLISVIFALVTTGLLYVIFGVLFKLSLP